MIYKEILKESKPFKSYVSFPDGHGNLAIIFSRIRANKSLQFLAIVINPRYGILDSFGFNSMTERDFYKIIDKFGNFWIPNRISCRYAFVKDNKILTGNSIFQNIGENMLKCQERLQFIKMAHLTELLAVIPSIKDETISYVDTDDIEAMKLYYQNKKKSVKEMNPEGSRKTKEECQLEAQKKQYNRMLKKSLKEAYYTGF